MALPCCSTLLKQCRGVLHLLEVLGRRGRFVVEKVAHLGAEAGDPAEPLAQVTDSGGASWPWP
jgi:hypothetical protein